MYTQAMGQNKMTHPYKHNNMIKVISLTTVMIFCLILGLQSVSDAETREEQMHRLYLERHLEKVRAENPVEYQRMLDDAGGVIMDCLSCHEEDFESDGNNPGNGFY